jgi:hypothetical protein
MLPEEAGLNPASSDTIVSALLRLLFNTHVAVYDRLLIEECTARETILTWVPRHRPLYSAATLLHTLPRQANGLVARSNGWRETARSRELGAQDWRSVRIACTIALDTIELNGNAPQGRSADVLVQLKKEHGRYFILSCVVVYDEPAAGPSPLTQIGQKRPIELRELVHCHG